MLGTLLVDHPDWLFHFAFFAVRVALGGCIIVHGLGKLGFHPTNPGGVPAFASWLKDLGVPNPLASAWAATVIEFGGGILFTLGFLTRPIALALTVNMVIAAVTGHKGGGYLILNNPPGAEYAINLAVLFAMFFLLGPGAISLDYLFFY